MATAEQQGGSVKSLAKGARLLKLFNSNKAEWSSREMAEALGFHPSSIQRLIVTLEAEGFLERTRSSRDGYYYGLGRQLYLLANMAGRNSFLVRAARPFLERLVGDTGETAHFCVLDDGQCLYLDKIDSPRSIRMVTEIGQRLPLHCTGVGKVLMSGLNERELNHILKTRGLPYFTVNTITDTGRLQAELDEIRSAGLGFDHEELEIGLTCVAAPVKDNRDRVVASLSLSGPVGRITAEVKPGFAQCVKRAAEELSATLCREEEKAAA